MNAAAVVAAGMVTVVVFPAVGFWRMRQVERVIGERRRSSAEGLGPGAPA